MPRPLRTSCDRCHSQKLKCPKQPGNATCTRCAKAGALCVFSPAALGVRRALAEPALEGGLVFLNDLGGDLDMNLDWSSMGLHEPQAAASPPAQHTLPEESNLRAKDPRSVCVQQLSSLALDIDGAFDLIPSDPGLHMPKDSPNPDIIALWSERNSQRRFLEQLFSSTQRLLDMYPSAMDIIFKQPDTKDCHDLGCIHSGKLPDELESELGDLAGNIYRSNSLDTFVLNLLLTCHTRVVDVLGVILMHTITCTKVTLASPNMREPQLDIPELRVGNFVASAESSASMQAVLLVHMTSVLVDRAKQLASKVTNYCKESSSIKQASMFKLQCEVLIEAGESKVVTLHKIRDVLLSMGYMR